MKPSKDLADKIRPHVTGLDWEVARDFIDQYTGNELDCKQLDMLTDWATVPKSPAAIASTLSAANHLRPGRKGILND